MHKLYKPKTKRKNMGLFLTHSIGTGVCIHSRDKIIEIIVENITGNSDAREVDLKITGIPEKTCLHLSMQDGLAKMTSSPP